VTTIPGCVATLERWEGEPLERVERKEIDPVALEEATALVGAIEGDECSLASFEEKKPGRWLHVSCSGGRYVINARDGEGPFFLRTSERPSKGHVIVSVAGFEWEFHNRFVLDRAEAVAVVEQFAGTSGWDFAGGGWEEAGVGPDSRPLAMPGGAGPETEISLN
jgi:hypothetical protein